MKHMSAPISESIGESIAKILWVVLSTHGRGCEKEKMYTFAVAQNWAKSATRRLRSSTKMRHKYHQEKGHIAEQKTASVVSE